MGPSAEFINFRMFKICSFFTRGSPPDIFLFLGIGDASTVQTRTFVKDRPLFQCPKKFVLIKMSVVSC